MSLINLREDVGLQLHLSRSGHQVTAIMALQGMHTCVAHCEARDASATTSGIPLLRVGSASFSLSFSHLREAAEILGLPIDGGCA